MSCFICPVCSGFLTKSGSVYTCENRHSFDISKYGYVNLLMSQQSSLKRHGDDKLMVQARRQFLEKGFYKSLSDKICECVRQFVADKGVIADVGCGEGYYTASVSQSGAYQVCGIDISKDALRYAPRAVPEGEFAVASAFNLPFSDNSVDCVLNVFAPSPYGEFSRVLKSDGVLIKAVPLEEHLWDLKCALYKEPYKNKPEKRDDDLFELTESHKLKYKINLTDSSDIGNLFKMTPYYYKTGREDAERLLSLSGLETTVHFCVEIYKKR